MQVMSKAMVLFTVIALVFVACGDDSGSNGDAGSDTDTRTDAEVCGSAECGTVNDNDEVARSCGMCTSPDTCQSNMCICTDERPDGVVCDSAECDTVTDLCGTARTCGTCTSPEICAAGACWPDCDPAGTCCNPDGTACAHGCDGTSCYADCNPATNACCAADGTIIIEAWRDSNTGLCWQDPPSTEMNWSDAVSYCGDGTWGGYDDWELPGIDELISLLRGCQNGTMTGDLSLSLCTMTPEGCVDGDSCSGTADCALCENNVPPTGGPGYNGCYWDPALSEAGVCEAYWSAEPGITPSHAWAVSFRRGDVSSNQKTFVTPFHARCVRRIP